ncbi:MAG: elongation factor P [Bacilli bacterium]|nr:elongation factor P [Bacillales bacterium]MDY2574527.1 elongation factor P [Bacilli bacterium]
MINVTEIRPGNTFESEGNIYTCIDIDLNKTAMAKMKVKVKAKNVKTGGVLDLSFIGGDKVELLRLDKKQMQYLYDDGTGYVFMDMETYDQISIDKARLEWESNFLVPEATVTITMYENEIIGIELPAKVTLKIVECEPAVRGDTVNKAMKDAYLETGLKVRVPLFVENGESIVVFTNDGSYDSRA